MKQNGKAIIIVIICLTLYAFGVAIFAASRSEKVKKKEETKQKEEEKDYDDDNDFDIVLNPKTIISHNKKQGWYDNSKFDYSKIKFTVFIDNNKYDYRNIVFSDKWELVNYDETVTDYEKSFVAIYSTVNYGLIEIPEKELTEQNKNDITSYLDTKNINYKYDKLSIEHFSYDLNQDGVKDELYLISNVASENFDGFNKTFSYGFIKILNQNITFLEDVADNINATNMCKPYLANVLKYEDTYNAIIGCTYASNKTKHFMYNVVNKEVKKLLETAAN